MRCKKCGMCCCGKMGPLVFPRDVIPLCRKLKISCQDFLGKFCEKSMLVISEKHIDVFYLKMKYGKCIFLNAQNMCEVYEHRPYQCVHAPFEYMAKYEYWKHMKCVTKQDFVKADSCSFDYSIFKELLKNNYPTD